MELEKTLQQLGLEEKEAIVYLTSLQLGKDTAFHIADRCSLKRSTVYVVLNSLNKRGLIGISKTKKAAVYEAVSPKRLLQQLEFRKHQMEEVLPLLLALHKDQPDKPKIQIIEGEASVALIYKEANDWMSKDKELLAFGRLDHFQKRQYRRYLDEWIRTMQNRRHRAREIPNDGVFEREYYFKRIKQNKNPNHQIRIVPDGTFANDNLIYGNKLAIFSVEKDLFVTLIESESIVKSYRNFFELAWQSAKPIA